MTVIRKPLLIDAIVDALIELKNPKRRVAHLFIDPGSLGYNVEYFILGKKQRSQ